VLNSLAPERRPMFHEVRILSIHLLTDIGKDQQA
jgi:hypothetical protein